MTENRPIIFIPARYQSKRFPGKPLAKVGGKPLIWRVYQNCLKSGLTAYVVTDHDEIEKEVKSFGGNVLRVDDDVCSGSSRIYLAMKRFFNLESRPSLVVNVQGDEPLLDGERIAELIRFHQESDFQVATMVKKRNGDWDSFNNPNVVKVIYDQDSGQCCYFSRSPIPFYSKNDQKNIWYQHIGVYSYRPSAFKELMEKEEGFFESVESLEQLRILGTKNRIGAILTEDSLIGVDTPSDIALVEGELSGKDK